MQLSQTNRKLIEQSRQIADIHIHSDMRAFLAATGSRYADDPDIGIVYAAFLGHAQSNLRALADLADEIAGAKTGA